MIVTPLLAERLPAAYCAAFLDTPYPLLLDSGGGAPALARYSYLTADPFLVLQTDVGGAWVSQGQTRTRHQGDPFLLLAELLAPYRLPLDAALPPFQGGAAGYWSYELGRAVERPPGRAVEDLPLPRLCVGLFDWALAYDHQQRRCWLLCTGWPSGTERAAHRRQRWVEERLARGATSTAQSPRSEEGIVSRVQEATFSRAQYEAAARRVLAYIAAGDVYQVNLSQRLSAP